MLIESVSNEKVKKWKKIRTKKYIDEYKEFIVEGEHLTIEAIKTNNATSLILLNETEFESDLPKYYVNEKVMNSISLMKTPPKVMAVVKVKEDNMNFGSKIIFLDNVQDPGNVGTIIRSAVAFGFDTIILSNDSVNVYNDKVIRATQGMIFKINIITGEKRELLKKLKDDSYTIYITKMNGEVTIEETRDDKVVFVLGNEGSGVSEVAEAFSDKSIRIPMKSDCESLNVAVACAIIMYIKRLL